MKYYLFMVLVILASYCFANILGLVDTETLKDTTKRYKKIEEITTKVDE